MVWISILQNRSVSKDSVEIFYTVLLYTKVCRKTAGDRVDVI